MNTLLRHFAFIFLINFLPDFTFAQRTINGIVTNEYGESLPSDTIIAGNSNPLTSTDFLGEFQFVIPDSITFYVQLYWL